MKFFAILHLCVANGSRQAERVASMSSFMRTKYPPVLEWRRLMAASYIMHVFLICRAVQSALRGRETHFRMCRCYFQIRAAKMKRVLRQSYLGVLPVFALTLMATLVLMEK